MTSRLMTLQEIFDEQHSFFVDIGKETSLFLTWTGDLEGNVEIESVGLRNIDNPHDIRCITQVNAERLGFVVDEDDESS